MCIGHMAKIRRQEYFEREINYNIIAGWADHKKLPKKENWWPLIGEKKKIIRLPSKAKLAHFDKIFRNLGKKTNG